MADWQPIETAPKDGSTIIIGNGRHRHQQRVAWFDEGADPAYPWHVEDAVDGFNHHKNWPTHWQPLLPDPPIVRDNR